MGSTAASSRAEPQFGRSEGSRVQQGSVGWEIPPADEILRGWDDAEEMTEDAAIICPGKI
jgi:hypothetical protein